MKPGNRRIHIRQGANSSKADQALKDERMENTVPLYQKTERLFDYYFKMED